MGHRFKLMAHRERPLMLCRMGEGEVSVTQLELTSLSPSSVSQHLALLRKAGVVSVRSGAQKRLYRLSDRVVGGLVRAFCRGFADIPAKVAGEHSTPTFPHTTAASPG